MDFVGLLVSWVITAISLLIMSKMPLGIEIDSWKNAIIAAIVFGFLNAIVKPILIFFTIPITILTLGLFLLFINPIIFGLAAYLVSGFRLRFGFISAMLGSFILALMNGIVDKFLALVIR